MHWFRYSAAVVGLVAIHAFSAAEGHAEQIVGGPVVACRDRELLADMMKDAVEQKTLHLQAIFLEATLQKRCVSFKTGEQVEDASVTGIVAWSVGKGMVTCRAANVRRRGELARYWVPASALGWSLCDWGSIRQPPPKEQVVDEEARKRIERLISSALGTK